MPFSKQELAFRQLWAFFILFWRYNFLFLLRTNKSNWKQKTAVWSNHLGLKTEGGLRTSSAVSLQMWNLREMVPSGKPYRGAVAGLWSSADWGMKKQKTLVLKDDRLINWCPFQLVLCQLILAPVQRSCNLGARCEAFLFHLVPHHLQKPYTSHLREQPSVGNTCTGRGGRQMSQMGYG